MFSLSAFLPQLQASKGVIALVVAALLFGGGVYVGHKYASAVEQNKALLKEHDTAVATEQLRAKSAKIEKSLAEALALKQVEIKYVTKYVTREVVRRLYDDSERDLYCALGERDIGLLNATRSGKLPDSASTTSVTPGTPSTDTAGDLGGVEQASKQGAKLSTVIQADIDLAATCKTIADRYNALIDWHENIK